MLVLAEKKEKKLQAHTVFGRLVAAIIPSVRQKTHI
jgi:hypothetical protein